MTLFLTYVLLGLSIALPVGTITVEMVKQGLKNGFMHGWAVGLGGMTIDVALIISLYFGLANLLTQPILQSIMWLIGAIFLCYIGIDSIKHANQGITMVGERTTKSWWASYRNGLLVAVSPSNLVFWVTVFGTVLASSFDNTEKGDFIVVGLGILTGILIHDVGLLMIVATSRRVMNKTAITWISVMAGIVLIGFSLYFGYEFWRSVWN